jgi:hypothetical protein
MSLPSLSDDQTATALHAIAARLVRHQQSAARGDTGPTPAFTRLADADAALWRCSCGAWRFGSRDCGTCAALRTAVAA